MACSYSSRTRIPLPSPHTSPSRCMSKGRGVFFGLLLYFTEVAKRISKIPVTVGCSSSVPPHSAAFCLPSLIKSYPAPSACNEEAHAAEGAITWPVIPRYCATFIAAVWEIHWKNFIEDN